MFLIFIIVFYYINSLLFERLLRQTKCPNKNFAPVLSRPRSTVFGCRLFRLMNFACFLPSTAPKRRAFGTCTPSLTLVKLKARQAFAPRLRTVLRKALHIKIHPNAPKRSVSVFSFENLLILLIKCRKTIESRN